MGARPPALSRLWYELRRRKVVRAAGICVVAAVAVIEAANNILPDLQLPPWTVTFVVVLALLGFPVALAVAWIYDVRPDAEAGDVAPRVPASPAGIPQTAAAPAPARAATTPTAPAAEHAPFNLEPDSAALSSPDAFRSWFRSAWAPPTPWTEGLEAYLRDVTRVQPDGSVLPIPAPALSAKLRASAMDASRDYAAVKPPALALYSPRFLDAPLDPERGEVMTAWERQYMDPFRAASIERIQRELKGVVVQRLPHTSHAFVPLQNDAGLAERIRKFLLSRAQS